MMFFHKVVTLNKSISLTVTTPFSLKNTTTHIVLSKSKSNILSIVVQNKMTINVTVVTKSAVNLRSILLIK